MGVERMNKNIVTQKYLGSSFIIILFSILFLFPSTATAQRSKRTAKIQSKTLSKTSAATGSLNVRAGMVHGSGEIALENYTGLLIKAIQFRVIATSTNTLKSVLPGSSVANRNLYNCTSVIVPGTPDAYGKRSDTVNVVVFGNGPTELPAGSSIKLLTLHYEQPVLSGTSADTVSFKITQVVGALSRGDAARVEAGPESSINLWK
jgi:hypothetical protein